MAEPMRGAFVVVEGTTGVGKTTVCRALAQSSHGRLFHFPPEFVRFRRAIRLDEEVPPLPRLAYYLAGTLHLSAMVEAILPAAAVVCDRYLPSVLAVIEAEGLLDRQSFDGLRGAVEPLVLRPDLTVLLVADHATALARSTHRGRSSRTATAVHRRALESEPYFVAWEAALRRHAARLGPMTEIDTTAMSAREAVEVAVAAVAEELGA